MLLLDLKDMIVLLNYYKILNYLYLIFIRMFLRIDVNFIDYEWFVVCIFLINIYLDYFFKYILCFYCYI